MAREALQPGGKAARLLDDAAATAAVLRGKTRDWTPAGPVRLGPSPPPTGAVQELKRSA